MNTPDLLTHFRDTEHTAGHERAPHIAQRILQMLRGINRSLNPSRIPGAETILPIARYIASEALSVLIYGRRDMPLIVGIETIASCNRGCSYCTISNKQVFETSRPTRVMKIELIDRILTDLSRIPRRDGKHGFVGTLHLNGYGEPLLDKRIYTIVQKAREALPEATIGFNSNGDYLTEETYQALKAAGVQEIIITLHDNQHRERIMQLAELHKSDGIIIIKPTLTSFSNRAGAVEISVDAHQAPGERCIHPTYAMEIWADGTMVYCANDSLAEEPMGKIDPNASESNAVLSSWDAPHYKKVRRDLRHGNVSEQSAICHNCRTPAPSPTRQTISLE